MGATRRRRRRAPAEVAAEDLPAYPDERERLGDRIVETAERWAEACIAERHAEVTEL